MSEKTPDRSGTMNVIPVLLPSAIGDIVVAAGGTDPKRGMEHAMMHIVGALPWLVVMLHELLTPDDYEKFRAQFLHNLHLAAEIAKAADPDAALASLIEASRLGVH